MRQEPISESRRDRTGLSAWMSSRSRVLGAVLVGALLLLTVGCGGATEDRDDSFTVGDSPRLIVNNENGYMMVTAGPVNAIRVRTTIKRPSRVEYQASQDGDTVTVDTEKEGGFPLFNLARSPGADIVVTAPANTRVELRSSNGRVELHGIQESGTLQTSNGKIVLENAKGDFGVHTSNGSIDVTRTDGNLTLGTSNGKVTITQAKGSFDVDTSNGRILFDGEMTPGGSNRLKTSNGDVRVTLVGEPGVSLDASTSNASVVSRLPVLTTSTGSKTRLVGTIGGGGAKLVIRTSNGSVTIDGR